MSKLALPHYHCVGDVRGDCGHRHRSPEAAYECLVRDRMHTRKAGGDSDRAIWRTSADGGRTRMYMIDGQWQAIGQTFHTT